MLHLRHTVRSTDVRRDAARSVDVQQREALLGAATMRSAIATLREAQTWSGARRCRDAATVRSAVVTLREARAALAPGSRL